jgi:hypothetical protein
MTLNPNPSIPSNSTRRQPRGRFRAAGLALLATFALLTPAVAATNGFIAPFYRGGAQTEAALWEVFSSAVNGANSPNAGTNVFAQTGNGTITQFDTNAFLTGSGNIYNLTTNSIFELTDSVSYTLGEVVFQTRTLGAELDYANVSLEYDLGGGPQLLFTTRQELLRQAGMGFTVVSLWQFDVSALGINSFTINFAAASDSLSLDAVVLDTASVAVVPEPATWALMALGTIGAFVMAQRRR